MRGIMPQSPNTAPCIEPGCDRNSVAFGLCMSHYVRKRRGSKKAGPVHSYGEDEIHKLPTTRVRPEVMKAMKKTAAADKKAGTGSGSPGAVQKAIVLAWFERGGAFLVEKDREPPTPIEARKYLDTYPFPVKKDVYTALEREKKRRKTSLYELLRQIYHDWFDYWGAKYGAEDAPTPAPVRARR